MEKKLKAGTEGRNALWIAIIITALSMALVILLASTQLP
mgnify:CR=1 FL=1